MMDTKFRCFKGAAEEYSFETPILTLRLEGTGALNVSLRDALKVQIRPLCKSESPAWGKRGFLMAKRRVGTARFMSRSTAADKGSTDNGAGSGPRPQAPPVRADGFSVAAKE